MSRVRRAIVAAAIAIALVGCGSERSEFSVMEDEVRGKFQSERIAILGRVIDAAGQPVANAAVSRGALSARSDAMGRFRIADVPRANALLHVTAPGFEPELVVLPAFSSNPELEVGDIPIDREQASVARMLYAGDTAFARRMLDPDEQSAWTSIPADHPNALVKASDPGPGTRAALEHMRPFFELADWSSVNLETPVTANPETPHPTKDFAFFTLPASLPALRWLGVDYVSLGNNHVYDYLEGGLRDTMAALQDAGLPFSGAGLNSRQAHSAHRASIGDQRYAFLGATSITGDEHQVTYVATDSKGGAADATRAEHMQAAIRRELSAGFIPVMQIHGGDEYTFEPTFVQERMRQAVDAGAAIVVGHHPHVPQGIGRHNGRYILFSLGNFVFDQDRLETMLSVVARVDMRGSEVQAIRFVPIYLKDFRPRPIGGRLAGNLLRRLGEFSRPYGVLLYPYAGQGWAELSHSRAVAMERTVDVPVHVGSSGTGIVDLRLIARPEESLAGADGGGQIDAIELGRDVLNFGDFESWDVDEGRADAPRWDFSGGDSYLCLSAPFRGAAAACSIRRSDSDSDSVTAFRNRIRVMGDAINQPNKRLTLLAYVAGVNAGALQVTSRYYASEGHAQFGEERIRLSPGGTFGWRQLSADLHMPDDLVPGDAPLRNPRALRLFLRHSPPREGTGRVAFDELAVINWEERVQGRVETPHGRDFLRVRAAPGAYRLRLVFRSYLPHAVARAGRVTG